MNNPLAAERSNHQHTALLLGVIVTGLLAVAVSFGFTTRDLLRQYLASAPADGINSFPSAILWPLLGPYVLLLLVMILICCLVGRFVWRKKKDMLDQIDSNRLALMELASHQMGAPLATFRWWLELLKDPDGAELLANKQIQEQIEDGINRMDEIVRALSDAKNIHAGELASSKEVVASLRGVLQRAASDSALALKQRNQTLEISMEAGLMPVQMDAKLIFGVLQVILQNAMAYSPEHTTIKIKVTKDGDSAIIAVSDQGYGIPKEDLPHIMEQFTRASNASKYRPVGNGLGLFIAKGIVETIGGDMWIESELGKGTTVYFSLPFEKQPKAESERATRKYLSK